MNPVPFYLNDKRCTTQKAWDNGQVSFCPPVIGAAKSKVITVADLPPRSFNRNSSTAARELAEYFLDFIRARQAQSEYFFLMPCMETLCEYFDLQPVEIQKAFHRLGLQGHDSLIPGYYGEISLWTVPMMTKHPEVYSNNVVFINSTPVFSS